MICKWSEARWRKLYFCVVYLLSFWSDMVNSEGIFVSEFEGDTDIWGQYSDIFCWNCWIEVNRCFDVVWDSKGNIVDSLTVSFCYCVIWNMDYIKTDANLESELLWTFVLLSLYGKVYLVVTCVYVCMYIYI
jgi:hypothetical protein